MFKSECLILIFILVILAILYFNTYTVELFTSKKITINKEENKQLIADNLQRIIDTIEEYKELDGIVKDLEDRISNKFAEKRKKNTTMTGEIATKKSLETEKLKLETENASYKKDKNQHTEDRVLLRLDVKKIEGNIIKNKKEKDRITKEKVDKESKIIELDKNIDNNDLELAKIATNKLLETEKLKLETENASYERDRNQYKDEIVLLKLNVEKLNNDIIKNKKEKDRITKEKVGKDSKLLELDTNIYDNDLELSEIEPQIPQLANNILKLERAIKTLTRQIEELETEKNNEIMKRTNKFNDLNEQLVSYELEELIEDLEILKKTQRYYKEKLEQFKEQNKIEFGKLKIKEDDYRKYNLIDDFEDDNTQKNMYYKLTNTELNTKLDEICAIDNTQEYCHTRDYGKVCQLYIINNKITDKTNDTILYNNECLKIKPFMNKLPYTITKK